MTTNDPHKEETTKSNLNILYALALGTLFGGVITGLALYFFTP